MSEENPVGPPSGAPIGMESVPEAPEGGEQRSGGRVKRLLIAAAVLLLVAGAGFAGGYFVADDSDQVSSLEQELADANDDLDSAQEANEELSAELDETTEAKNDLARKLKAERSISGNLPAPDPDVNVSADADYVIGEAGTVGSMVMRPTSLESAGASGGGVRYLLEIDIKNDGDEPIMPLCGGSEVTILDGTGRKYSGEAVLEEDTPNCSDDIQPGLSQSGYRLEFKLPKGSKPALIEIVEESYSDEEPVTWAVK